MEKKTMKAVRMIAVGQPLEMQEIPVPDIGSLDVLIKIKAAGICHSDVHYRAGKSPVRPLPMTLGHEIAGVVEALGNDVHSLKLGDRVCLHYLLSCGNCFYCSAGSEQFCVEGSMLGHYTNGGYAEYIAVPERNAVLLPEEIPFEQGAVLMCSSSTSFHTLRKARLKAGETVAVFGIGGLGISAVQLAYVYGALTVYAVDINPEKLKLAEKYGAVPVDARKSDSAAQIMELTRGKGVDVALELIGLSETMSQAVRSLGVMGRAVLAGINDQPLALDTYQEVLGKEAEVIGSNDHLLQELPLLIEWTRLGRLDLSQVVTQTVPLEAGAINQVLDDLEQFSGQIRTVILP
jgi:2-desacetyl-2-hydroxyethyl bacteriochlorophyllide A dehydrogenase